VTGIRLAWVVQVGVAVEAEDVVVDADVEVDREVEVVLVVEVVDLEVVPPPDPAIAMSAQ
jgi:hypothetical protein